MGWGLVLNKNETLCSANPCGQGCAFIVQWQLCQAGNASSAHLHHLVDPVNIEGNTDEEGGQVSAGTHTGGGDHPLQHPAVSGEASQWSAVIALWHEESGVTLVPAPSLTQGWVSPAQLTSQAPTPARSGAVHSSLSLRRPRSALSHSLWASTGSRATFSTLLSPVPAGRERGAAGTGGSTVCAGIQGNGTGRGCCGQGVHGQEDGMAVDVIAGGCGREMMWKRDAVDRVIAGARDAVGRGMQWAGKHHRREML